MSTPGTFATAADKRAPAEADPPFVSYAIKRANYIFLAEHVLVLAWGY